MQLVIIQSLVPLQQTLGALVHLMLAAESVTVATAARVEVAQVRTVSPGREEQEARETMAVM